MTLPNTVTDTPGCSGGCANGSTTGYAQRNYNLNLFSNSIPSTTPFSGYSAIPTVAPTAGSTMFDSADGVTFAMLSQTGTNNDFWSANNNSTLTIPVGIFGVQNVWTMLNNYFGPTGHNDTNVSFVFDNNQDGSDLASKTTVTVDLINGQEIRSAVQCTANCSAAENGFSTTLNASTTVTGAQLQCSGLGCPSAVTVLARNLFTSLTANPAGLTGGASTSYAGSTVNTFLDAQGFQFGDAFAGEYLVSIGVQQLNRNATLNGLNESVLALSAATVQTAAPEPSTVILLFSAVGILGFVQFHRRRA